MAFNNLLLEAIERPKRRLILVIGASDTGKTTFVEHLLKEVSRLFRTSVVDLDMGQSSIGPPTTLGWAKVPQDFSSLTLLKEEEFYFTGTTTPVGSLLPAIIGAKVIVDKALRDSEKVIVDTTGLISEPTGRVLKQSKIEILRPDVIVCLEKADELKPIIEPFKYQGMEIISIKPSLNVRIKSPAERAEYRYKKMENYLQGAERREFYLDELGIFFITGRLPMDTPSLKNRIVSLRNTRNEDMALGVIEHIKQKEGKIYITTRELKEEPVTLVIGKAVMDRKERTLKNINPLI